MSCWWRGLIAGVAMTVKQMNPKVSVYGVQTLACPSMKQSLLQNKPVMVEATPTMADGIAVKKPGQRNFDIIKEYVDDIVCVDEMEIARSMLMLLERNKLLVEGSGASPVAALLYEKLHIKGKKITAVLSGGNVDVHFISKIIERGLVEAGRYAHFSLTLKDKPGELEKVLRYLTELNANIQNVNLQHMGRHIYPGFAQLEISLETKNNEHIEQIHKVLKNKGYNIRV